MIEDIFELIDKKFNIIQKTNNLCEYIFNEDNFLVSYVYKTFIEIFSEIFHYWEYNNCCLDVNDFLFDLGISQKGNTTSKTISLELSTNSQCYKFLQFLQNALDFSYEYYKKNYNLDKEFIAIQRKINYIIDKCQLQFFKDNGYYKLTDSTPIVRNVAQLTDEETALKLLSYNEVENANNIEHKRQILKYLANITEPITKGYSKKSGDKYELYNNLDFALNNFNIRHNNEKGEKKNNFINNINDSDLIKAYDDIFNLIVSVLALYKSEESFENIKRIRKDEFKK